MLMKSCINLIITILLLVPLAMKAQTVSGTLYKIPQQKVYLNAYTGFFLATIDSVMMDQNGYVAFNTPLKTGMYMLETELGNGFDFIYDGNPVSFMMPNSNDWKSVQFIRSEINTEWLQYQIRKDETFSSQEPLKQIMRDNNKNTEPFLQAKREYDSIQNDFHDFTDDLLNNNNNYAAKLIRVDRPSLINLDYDFDKQRDDMIEHFFDDIDFKDTTLIPTNVITTKIIDYLGVVQHSKQSSKGQIFAIIMGVDNVLRLSTKSYAMYKFVFQYLIEGFSHLNLYDVVDYMTRLPYVDNMNLTGIQYEELNTITENNCKVRIGDQAPEIQGNTLFDKYFDLYSVDNEYIIVFFWSYSCEHCREMIGDLSTFIQNNPNYTLVSVSVTGEPKKIKKLIKKYLLEGYFYWDGLEWKSPAATAYAVNSTPSIFILDKNKKILLKPFNINDLIDFNNKK